MYNITVKTTIMDYDIVCNKIKDFTEDKKELLL